MNVIRYAVGVVGFLLCWFVVAVILGLVMVLVFPLGHDAYTPGGIILNWRNLPGTLLGLFAGVHSFRASIREPAYAYRRNPHAIVRQAADYAPQEVREVQQLFATQRKRRVRHLWFAFVPLGVGALCLATTSERSLAGVGGFFICVFLFLVLGPTIPGLYCPGCTESIESRHFLYCPECGGHRTVQPDQQRKMRCGRCARPITFGSGRGQPRRYAVRCCVCCGLLLAEHGVRPTM